MKCFKFIRLTAAVLSSAFALTSFSQTATLNYGTNSPVSCTHAGIVQIGTNGDLTISCTTPVNNTGTPAPGSNLLTVTLSGSGSVSASTGTLTCTTTSCAGTYAAATPATLVTLTANALNGSTFSGWSGGNAGCSGNGTCAVTMDMARSVTATFTGGTAPPPTPAGVVIVPLPSGGATGAASIFATIQGTTYAFAIPIGSAGQISVTPEGGPPLMGTGASWEVSLTTTPGDWATAKTMGTTANPKDGSLNTPYYAAQGGQSGGLNWVLTASNNLPVITANQQWYFNLRVTNMSGSIYVQPALGK